MIRAKYLLRPLVTCLLLVWGLAPALAQEKASAPAVEAGQLDLRSWNTESHPILRLAGNWGLVAPSLDSDEVVASVEVPMNPRETPFDTVESLRLYRLRVQLNPSQIGRELGLSLGFIPKAYRVLVDGQQVFKLGEPSADPNEHQDAAGRQLVSFPAPSGQFNLDILVSNPDYPRTGIHEAPLLGAAEDMQRWLRVREMWDSFVIASLVLVGLVLILGYFRIPQDARPGLLGVFSLFMGIRHGLGGSLSFHVIFPGLAFDTAYLIGYGMVYVAVACLGSYIEAAGFIRLGRRVLSVLWGATGLAIILLLPGDLQLAYRTMMVYQVLLLFYIGGIVLEYFLALEHPPGYRLFGFSFLTMAVGGVVDFLEFGELAGGPLLTSLMILVGILMQAGHLVGRLSTAIGQARRLNQDLRSVLLLQDRIQSSLEQTVRSRTEALYTALEEARSANRAKTQFLANISHEVRTPLNGIVGFTDLLERSADPEASKLYVELIRKESDRLLEMINQLLDISRIEAKRLVLNPRPVNLAARLHEFARQIRLSAAQKGLQFSMSLDPGLPQNVELDIQRFLQILHNLLSNSLKFTIEGGVFLDVRVDRADDVNQSFDLEVQVSDTGIGIPQDKLAKIFESFEQASPGISRRFGGSGLGMSISRELVWAMGGTIQVHSREGEGTRFTVRIPMRWSAEPLLGEVDAEADGPILEPRWKGSPTVLLVDDYELNIFMLKQYLDGLGLNLLTADSGEAALQLARTRSPELILLDIHMPGIDGLETARILRSEAYAGRIIGLSASAFAQDRIQALEAGMDDFLSKPIRRRVLLDALSVHFPPDAELPRENASRAELPAVIEDLSRDIPVYLGLLGDFLRSAQALAGDLQEASQSEDWHRLKRAAHTLRGGAAAIGAETLAAAAKALELTANHQNPADTKVALSRVLEAARELSSAVDSLSS